MGRTSRAAAPMNWLELTFIAGAFTLSMPPCWTRKNQKARGGVRRVSASVLLQATQGAQGGVEAGHSREL